LIAIWIALWRCADRAFDLPLKVLVWEDASDVTWLSYNDPCWLAKRHGLPHGTDAVAGALTATLGAIVKMAAGP
jgi:uncharacterized protein (DUF302 family)